MEEGNEIVIQRFLEKVMEAGDETGVKCSLIFFCDNFPPALLTVNMNDEDICGHSEVAAAYYLLMMTPGASEAMVRNFRALCEKHDA